MRMLSFEAEWGFRVVIAENGFLARSFNFQILNFKKILDSLKDFYSFQEKAAYFNHMELDFFLQFFSFHPYFAQAAKPSPAKNTYFEEKTIFFFK